MLPQQYSPPTLRATASRKRRAPDVSSEHQVKTKKRCILKLRMPTSKPPTPPIPTLDLHVTIPQPPEPDHRQKRVLAARKGAAKRWAPKLTNPYPNDAEIRQAYDLKLMRHYQGPPTAPVTNLKPLAQKSERVARLLKQFPLLTIPKPQPQTLETQQEDHEARVMLRENKSITASSDAVDLATKNFATTEKCRQKSARRALRESGLWSEDLRLEEMGMNNGLPEWKKWRTGEYAQRKREEEKAVKKEVKEEAKIRLKVGRTHITVV